MTAVEHSTDTTSIWTTVGRVLMLEVRVYQNIGRAIARRPAVPDGALGFSHHKPVLSMVMVFVVLSAIEIPIADLLVQRWPVVRLVVLILGIWGVTWMVGFACAQAQRPHTVGDDGLRIRDGLDLDIHLAWHQIDGTTVARRGGLATGGRFEDTNLGRTLHLPVQEATNVEVTLTGPVTVGLPGRPPKGGRQTVNAIRVWVDDPEGFTEAVRRRVPPGWTVRSRQK